MSGSEIAVTVLAGDGVAEVAVEDDRFRVLARGIQRLETRLPPGIYRATARNGEDRREELFALAEGDPQRTVRLAAVEFASPMPLAGSYTSHEYHMAAASEMSSQYTAHLGHGASLAILLRDPGDDYRRFDDTELARFACNFADFRLSGWRGEQAVDLRKLGRLDPGDGMLLAHVEVTPGTYALQVPAGGGERLCLPLVVPANWTLQTYLNLLPAGGDPLARRVELDDAAVVLERLGEQFHPDRDDLSVMEVARRALARGDGIIDRDSMGALLHGKFDNPMLGLLAAHLLLLRRKPNLDLLETVLDNTGGMIGADHPDLLALGWKLASLGAPGIDTAATAALLAKVGAPPMLQLGWRYLSEAAMRLPRAPSGGPFALAGQMVDASVWVKWVVPEPGTEALPAEAGHAAGDTPTATPVKSVPAAPAEAPSDASEVALIGILRRVAGAVAPLGAELAGRVAPLLDELGGRILRRHDGHAVAATVDKDADEPAGDEDTRGFMERSLQMLAESVDWVAVVRYLKKVGGDAGRELALSPAQRRLVLAMKELRELATDGDGLRHDELRDWLAREGVVIATLTHDLGRLTEVAERVVERLHEGRAGDTGPRREGAD